MVKNKLDTVMTEAVNQIPPLPPRPSLPFSPPPDLTIPIGENVLETLMKLNIAPSDPVQDPVVHINQQGVRMEFNVHLDFLPFNFPCAVSFLPTIDNQGNLIARDVKIEGIASLGISPDELASVLNKHFSNALKKLNYPISSINLQPGRVDITLK